MRGLPDELNLTKLLDDCRHDGGLKIIIAGGMRAPIVNGEVTLEPCWTASIYERVSKRRALIRLVDATPEGLFSQLAALSEAGEVQITVGDEA